MYDFFSDLKFIVVEKFVIDLHLLVKILFFFHRFVPCIFGDILRYFLMKVI